MIGSAITGRSVRIASCVLARTAILTRRAIWFRGPICVTVSRLTLWCGIGAPVVAASLGHINFASDDGLYSASGGLMIKILRREQIPVIGHSHGGHGAARCFLSERFYFASSVEKAVIRVQM